MCILCHACVNNCKYIIAPLLDINWKYTYIYIYVPVFHASALNPCTCGRETCVNSKNQELGSCKVTKETLSQQSSRGFLSSSGDKLAQAFSLGCWSQQDIIHVVQLAKCQLRLKLKVRALVVPMHGAPKEKRSLSLHGSFYLALANC